MNFIELTEDVVDVIHDAPSTASLKSWAKPVLVEITDINEIQRLHATHTEGWRKNISKAKMLQKLKFKHVQYVIPGLLPEGLTILAGKPKVGKSWLALDLALAVAAGRFVLGDTKPAPGDVLYCALEDNPRRLQKRLNIIAGDIEWPDRLSLTNQWRRLDSGGTDDIREWGAEAPNPRLVILDTLAGVRPERNSKDTTYDGDYRALRELHGWANEAGVAVLVLHHTRKMEADDPLDTISGTLALAGCADTSAVLAKSANGGFSLYVRGRDIEEAEHALVFNKENCRWTMLGDAAEIGRSSNNNRILATLIDAKEPRSPKEIQIATGLERNTVDKQLYRLCEDSLIIKCSRGRYVHHERSDLLKSD